LQGITIARLTTSTTTRVATTLVAILAAAILLRYGRVVLIPIVLSVLLAYTLAPLVNILERAKVPRLAGTLLVMLSLTGGLAFSVYSLRGQAIAMVEEIPNLARRLRAELRGSAGSGGALEKVQRAGSEIERTSRELSVAGSSTPPASAPPVSADGLVIATTGGMLALAGHATAIFFMVLFMLLSGDLFERKLLAIAGPSRREVVQGALAEITMEIRRYLWVRLITSVVVSLATWGALAWLGMPHAALWGIAAGVCNVIPYVGPVIISSGLAVAGFIHFGSVGQAALVAGVALVITALEGWLLEPPLMGRAEGLNTVAILVGLVFWTWAWGAWGTVLAVPLLSVIKTVCARTSGLRPVAELLAE
jgi:predicted PurR-regulated permease PerM